MSGTEGPEGTSEQERPGLPGPPPNPGYPPPSYPPIAGYGYPGGADLQGGKQSGERARAALWAGVVAYAIQAACSTIVILASRDYYLDLFDDISNGRVSRAQPPTGGGYLAVSLVSQLSSVVLLIVGIVFLVWFHKALSNARALGVHLTRSPGWGVAGFLIPIINLWFPYQSMRDLVPAAHPAGSRVGRWWACYLGGSFATTFAVFGAFVAPIVGALLVAAVAVLYYLAAVYARELITASGEVQAALAGPPQVPGAGYPGPGAPLAPQQPPTDPSRWN